ncbi:unnamed protein product [Urochloa humidicola]
MRILASAPLPRVRSGGLINNPTRNPFVSLKAGPHLHKGARPHLPVLAPKVLIRQPCPPPSQISVVSIGNPGAGGEGLGGAAPGHPARCHAHVAVDEPMLWRHLDMSNIPLSSPGWCTAIDRSAWQCDTLRGYCDDESLLYLVERAPSLKTLHLSWFDGSNDVLKLGLKKLPLLENLKIELSYGSTPTDNLLGSACQACPRLKELSLKFHVSYDYDYSPHEEMLLMETIEDEIPTMSALQSLELLDCDLTTKGLTTILDNCPLLESLHITTCYYDYDWMSSESDETKKLRAKELQSKCARVRNLILPDDSDGYYESYFPYRGDGQNVLEWSDDSDGDFESYFPQD